MVSIMMKLIKYSYTLYCHNPRLLKKNPSFIYAYGDVKNYYSEDGKISGLKTSLAWHLLTKSNIAKI